LIPNGRNGDTNREEAPTRKRRAEGESGKGTAVKALMKTCPFYENPRHHNHLPEFSPVPPSLKGESHSPLSEETGTS
jgi:hypothetical protein